MSERVAEYIAFPLELDALNLEFTWKMNKLKESRKLKKEEE